MFGWFCFNAESALQCNGIAGQAFMITCISGSSAMVSWMILDQIINKKMTALGLATGLIIGLSLVTPAAGCVPVWTAVIIGAIASPLSMFFITVVKCVFKYDDSLDVFGYHGVGGIWEIREKFLHRNQL